MTYGQVVVAALLVLLIAACEDGPGALDEPTATGNRPAASFSTPAMGDRPAETGASGTKEAQVVPATDGPTDTGDSINCETGYYIMGGVLRTGFIPDPDSLETRALERDIVVRATLVNDEVKVVDAEVATRLGNSIEAEPYGGWSHYGKVKYALLHELELRVHEYLKGQGPDRIVAIVAGQRASDSKAVIECVKRGYEEEVSFEKTEAIFFLSFTHNPDEHYLGLSDTITRKRPITWSPMMPGSDGEFYFREKDEWFSLDEIRRRVSDVIEEYTRFEDAGWQECIVRKYQDREWAKTHGMSMGMPIPLDMLPKQVFSFSGENAPVTAGTTIWEFPDGFYQGRYSPRLEGENSEQFEITFHEDYQVTFNSKWEGTDVKGPNSVYSAYWTLTTSGTTSESTSRQPAHILTATEDLPQGVHRFSISWRDNEARDCGQDPAWTNEYLVVVTVP